MAEPFPGFLDWMGQQIGNQALSAQGYDPQYMRFLQGAQQAGGQAQQLIPHGVDPQQIIMHALLMNAGNIGMQAATGMNSGIEPAPMALHGPVESTPGYVYHATNADRLEDIASSGKLLTHKPGDFTDQDAWPDGSTVKRNYFTPTAQNTWQFAPEVGTPVLLRMPQGAHPIKREGGTGDLYSTKPVPADKLEYLGNGGQWHPVVPQAGSEPSQAPDVTPPPLVTPQQQQNANMFGQMVQPNGL